MEQLKEPKRQLTRQTLIPWPSYGLLGDDFVWGLRVEAVILPLALTQETCVKPEVACCCRRAMFQKVQLQGFLFSTTVKVAGLPSKGQKAQQLSWCYLCPLVKLACFVHELKCHDARICQTTDASKGPKHLDTNEWWTLWSCSQLNNFPAGWQVLRGMQNLISQACACAASALVFWLQLKAAEA